MTWSCVFCVSLMAVVSRPSVPSESLEGLGTIFTGLDCEREQRSRQVKSTFARWIPHFFRISWIWPVSCLLLALHRCRL